MQSIDIRLTSEVFNNKLNYLSTVNFWCSERIWSYGDYGTGKLWFLFFVCSDHHGKTI